MFCENCGAQISPNDNFCTNCGAQIIKKNIQEPVSEPVILNPEETVLQPEYFSEPQTETGAPSDEPVPLETESAEIPVYGSSDPDFSKHSVSPEKKGTSAIVIILAVIASVIITGIAGFIIVKNVFGYIPQKNKDYYEDYVYDLPDDFLDGLFDEKTDIDDFFTGFSKQDLEDANDLAMDDYDRIIAEIVDGIDESGPSAAERAMLMEYSRADIWDLDNDGLDEFAALYSTDGRNIRYVICHYTPNGSGGFHTKRVDDLLIDYDEEIDIWAAVCTATVNGQDCLAVIYEDSSISDFLSSEIHYYAFNGSGYQLLHTAGAQMRTDTESFEHDYYYFDDSVIDYDTWHSLLYDDMNYIIVEYGTAEDASGVSFCDFAE